MPLIEASMKRIFPFLLINLGLMKQFVLALATEGSCLQCFTKKFPHLTTEKIWTGIFNGTAKDFKYDVTMND